MAAKKSKPFLEDLIDRQREIERSAMEFPVADFSAYQRLVGRWLGLQEAVVEYQNRVNEADDED